MCSQPKEQFHRGPCRVGRVPVCGGTELRMSQEVLVCVFARRKQVGSAVIQIIASAQKGLVSFRDLPRVIGSAVRFDLMRLVD